MRSNRSERGLTVVMIALMLVVLAAVTLVGVSIYRSQAKELVKQNGSSTGQNDDDSKTKYLTIEEWGVRSPYDGSDLQYIPPTADNPHNVGLISARLSSLGGENCDDPSVLGNAGRIGRYLPTDNVTSGPEPKTAEEYLSQDFAASGSKAPTYAKVGDYYYIYGDPHDYCTTDVTAIADVETTVRGLVEHLEPAE